MGRSAGKAAGTFIGLRGIYNLRRIGSYNMCRIGSYNKDRAGCAGLAATSRAGLAEVCAGLAAKTSLRRIGS